MKCTNRLTMLPARILFCYSCAASCLAGCLAVRDGQVRARDLSETVPAFASLPGDTILAPTPGTGVKRIISPATLQQMAIQLGLDASFTTSICIERASRILDTIALKSALDASLAEAGNQSGPVVIEILDFSRYPVPEGTLEFSRSGLQTAGEIGPQP